MADIETFQEKLKELNATFHKAGRLPTAEILSVHFNGSHFTFDFRSRKEFISDEDKQVLEELKVKAQSLPELIPINSGIEIRVKEPAPGQFRVVFNERFS